VGTSNPIKLNRQEFEEAIQNAFSLAEHSSGDSQGSLLPNAEAGDVNNFNAIVDFFESRQVN
jgi:hypothetical protein